MSERFQIIYADPPWVYRDKGHAGERGAGYRYALMSPKQLAALRPFIDSIAAEDCLLAMWWVPPQPAEALQLVRDWGFDFKTMKGFTWHKVTKNGKDNFGMGNYTRIGASEDCLFATRGRPKRVSKGVRHMIHAPVRAHSQKPDEARTRLVELMGDVPRIELFARQKTPGWSVFGNEVESDVKLEV
jgi:N6-adenosine-specific RNA methylase IME4